MSLLSKIICPIVFEESKLYFMVTKEDLKTVNFKEDKGLFRYGRTHN
jgi:hypothetical protein